MEPRNAPQATTDSSAARACSHLTDCLHPNACAQQDREADTCGRAVTVSQPPGSGIGVGTIKSSIATAQRDNSSRCVNTPPKNLARADEDIQRSLLRGAAPRSKISGSLPQAAAASWIWKTNRLPDNKQGLPTKSSNMADKLSSPSSSSSTGYGTQTPQARGGNGDVPHLVIRRQPPTHVFSNEAFEFEVGLDLPKTSPIPLADATLEMEATLHYAKKAKPVGPEARLILAAGVGPLSLATSGPVLKRQCKVSCEIDMENVRRDAGAFFVVHLAPKQDVGQPLRGIPGASTNTIQMVNGERIPLQLTLCYNSMSGAGGPLKVINQDFLRVLGNTPIQIERDSGSGRIRFRIEDVSKNHQGQGFKVEVGPDLKLKNFKDIAPGYTPSVLVRSKRNKPHRSQRGKRTRGGSEKQSSPIGNRNVRPAISDQPQQEISFENVDVVRLREAMKGVINWTEEVVNGLYPLTWQTIGYNPNPDGSPDYSRPYYTMPNPNACISRVLSMYSDTTRENLRVLLNAVEQASPVRQEETPYAAASININRDQEQPQSYGMMGSTMQMHPSQQPQPQLQPPQQPQQQGMPLHLASARQAGIHPTVASEAFRDKPPDAASMPLPFQQSPSPIAAAAAAAMPPRHPQMQYARSRPQQSSMMGDDSDNLSMHSSQRMQSIHSRTLPGEQPVVQDRPMDSFLTDVDAQDVHYVLAIQYNSMRTGALFGFPAYNRNREILGFFRANSKMGAGHIFTPISMLRDDFGPVQIYQANNIIEDAIKEKKDRVFEVSAFGGNINNLLDELMVYDWAKGSVDSNPSHPGGSATG